MATSRVAVGTIVTKNFLSFARVLAGSVRVPHPDVPFFTLLADEPEGLFDPAAEPFEVVPPQALCVPDFRQMCFKYTRQQLSIAVKPYLLRYLLDRGFDAVVLLDADILVTASLDPLLDAAAEHAIVLTPHLLEHLTTADRVERELNILQSGTYNGGCIGVSARPSTLPFLSWWAERLRTHCRHAIESGMHFDQRWLDLVPVLFEDVHVLRDRGCNVAYWNLPERSALVEAIGSSTAASRCRFFHFSGFEPETAGTVTRYSSRLTMDAIGPAAELFERYRRLVRQEGFDALRSWPYAYSHFDNGVAIPDLARILYAEMDETARFGDPFRVFGSQSYFHWLTEPVKGAGDARIARLWESAYRRRPDLQSAFPDLFGADHAAFLDWASSSGMEEHGVPASMAPRAGARGLA
jgi:hypothetical protein